MAEHVLQHGMSVLRTAQNAADAATLRANDDVFEHVRPHVIGLIVLCLRGFREKLRRNLLLRCERIENHSGEHEQPQQGDDNDQS